jgi:hypothetical protein
LLGQQPDVEIALTVLATTPTLLQSLPAPTPWPTANARMLGLGVGLPVAPLDRLAAFSAKEFERLTLEWASDYLASRLSEVYEVQQRGGAGDKGRDIVVWFDPPSAPQRRWALYQCKHYGSRLGAGTAAAEIGKVLHYTFTGAYPPPREYWFVTHLGTTSDFQDLLDDPAKLKAYIIAKWDERCSGEITSKAKIPLDGAFLSHVQTFDFSIFRAKQPLALVEEHAQTRYHSTVFGLPFIERPKPPTPPSAVAPSETRYVAQLFEAIGEYLGKPVSGTSDLIPHPRLTTLFDRSRLTFYCAEGLKELSRDRMADPAFFNTLLDEFGDGLFHDYTAEGLTGLDRLRATVKSAQALQLGGHALAQLVVANDREGMCHHLANEGRVSWCSKP